MIQFSPDPKLLDSIDCDQVRPIVLCLPGYDATKSYFSDDTQTMHIIAYAFAPLMIGLLEEKYKERFEGRVRQNILTTFSSELFRNAAEHGNKNSEYKYMALGLWLGKKGILFAYRDEGDFFSKTKTKILYESRSANPTTRSTGIGGHGTRKLYREAGSIIVAPEENTLYATYLF